MYNIGRKVIVSIYDSEEKKRGSCVYMLRNGKRLAICMKEKGILEYLRICSHIRILTVGGTGNYVIIGRNVKLTNITVTVTGNNNKNIY